MALANWHGIEGIKFRFCGEWSDGEIYYNGHTFNPHDVEDCMFEEYIEEGGDDTDFESFSNYMKLNSDTVKLYLEDILRVKAEETEETDKIKESERF